MKHLARDLYQLPLMPRDGVNAYLVGDVLVDSGYPLNWNRLHAELGGRKPAAHALTHAHADHAGNSGRLQAEDGLEVWVGENDRELLESGRPEPGHVPAGRGLLRRYMAFSGVKPDRLLKAGEELDAGFVVIDTPGHSPGHVSFWREADRTLVCGDVFFNMSMATTAPGLHQPPGIFTPDPARNRQSERLLAELRPALVCFGHGPPLRDPEKLQNFVDGLGQGRAAAPRAPGS